MESICQTLEKSYQENQKSREKFTQEINQWQNSNKTREIKDLSCEDASFLLAAMNIEYDTKQQPSGLNLCDAGASILKDIFKMESLGDRKRVLETVSKKRIDLIQFPPIPVLSQDKQETNKVLSWNHQDVFNWISDQEIKKNLKKHKLSGRQLLSLNDEEIEKELGMNEENKEKLKRIIEKLKKEQG